MTDVRLRIRPTRADEAGQPFVDLVHERAGPRRAQRVIAFMQGWGVVADELERVPSVEEYATRFQIPIATAYREQAAFRESFASEETPDRILGVLWDELGRRRGRQLLSMPVRVDVDGPEDASVVLGWLVASLLDRLPAGAASAADRALPPLASSARPRREEVARAYRLGDHAVFAWVAALLGRAEPALAEGLTSLERLQPFDADSALYAAAMLREYAAGAPTLGPALTAAGRAAEAAATLGVRARVADALALQEVGVAAAETLTLVFAARALLDVVTPAYEIVAELLGTSGPADRAERT